MDRNIRVVKLAETEVMKVKLFYHLEILMLNYIRDDKCGL